MRTWIHGCIFLLISFGIARTSAKSDGYDWICKDNLPEGMAILDRNGADQLLAIFKADRVWTVPLDDFIEMIGDKEENEDHEIVKSVNGQDIKELLPGAPVGPKRMVSFFGLNTDDPFYNNLLIFQGDDLYRFRINGAELNQLKATFIAKHTTNFWPQNKLLNRADVAFQTIRGTRMLFVHSNVNYVSISYILTQGNLDYPISVPTVRKQPIPYGSSISSTYTVPSKGNSSVSYHLSFLKTGFVCYDSQCKRLDKLMSCDPFVAILTNSFLFWLNHKANMTIRQLVVSLIVVMVLNSLLAIMFVWKQINKIVQLT